MLKINGLVKKYGKFTAVDGLDLHIPEGHIYGFIGENGAGKTTTMKITAGLLKATKGEVLLDGIDVTKDSKKTRHLVGYMPDFFGVYDDLMVHEYMSFYAGIHGVYSHKRVKITNQLLALVRLEHKKDYYVDSLSRGMKQRLCLARTLIHDPKLLILDEPASGLDPKSRIEMKNILKELKKMGKTILVSSHILPELAELSTSLGIIHGGKLVVSGEVDEIMRKIKGGNAIKVKVLDRKEDAIGLLKEQPGIRDVAMKGELISCTYDGQEDRLVDILKQLVSKNIKVVGFYEEEKDIESIFLHLMEGEQNENESNH